MQIAMLKVSQITIERLRNNELAKELPEFYQLKDLVENNRNHNHDVVFEHSLNTAESMREQIASSPELIQRLLENKVGEHTRKELLMLTTLLHDIGKLTTKKQEGEKVWFPGHDESGARIAGEMLKRTDMSDQER